MENGPAVIYGGVGHHIEDLDDDNIMVFYKVCHGKRRNWWKAKAQRSSLQLYNSLLGLLWAWQRSHCAHS